MTTLYYVGPDKEEFPKHPWLMTGNPKVAENYAKELDGRVFTKDVVAPRFTFPQSWHGDR